MRKIILCVAVSLDGFIEGPHGEFDWCFNDQDYGLTDFFKRIDALFMGRKSYDLTKSMLQGKGAQENPWKGIVTYVFSNSLKEVNDPDVRLISGDILPAVREIRQQNGKDIWLFGGAQLITVFVNNDLVDEYWLAVHPIVLGSGKPLFQNIAERKRLRLSEHKIYDTGLVSLCYVPAPLK